MKDLERDPNAKFIVGERVWCPSEGGRCFTLKMSFSYAGHPFKIEQHTGSNLYLTASGHQTPADLQPIIFKVTEANLKALQTLYPETEFEIPEDLQNVPD